MGPRDKAASPTSQQIKLNCLKNPPPSPPKRVKYLATPSSIFIFISSLSNQSEAIFVELGECSQNMLSEAFMDPEFDEFDEYFELYSRSKRSPS